MKVLMFGWEFPPFSNGGLGTACQGLTKGLKNNGADVTFVLPKAAKGARSDVVRLVVANTLSVDGKEINVDIEFKEIDSLLIPYLSEELYFERFLKHSKNCKGSGVNGGSDEKLEVYGKNLFEEVYRYSLKAGLIAKLDSYDVIHAHDWMTYKAGIIAKQETGKPLVVHVHATEFDRTGGHPNQYIYDLEREGMHMADLIIAVSHFTKQKIIEHYGIEPDKVQVVHNAVEFNEDSEYSDSLFERNDKIALFLGRLTIQKGPEYFLYAAKKLIEKDENLKFVIAGSGDMEKFLIEKAAELGISHKVLFSGFLRGKDIDRAYKMADVYVMPSVSEPFGITPLESMRNGTPVIISKQSGVSEVINHALKVDFWDINQLANKIYAVTNYPSLKRELAQNGRNEVDKMSWNDSAKKCIDSYNHAILINRGY